MVLQFFDFEVYPEWWCVTFGLFPDGKLNNDNRWDFVQTSIKESFITITSDEPKARDQILEIVRNSCIVGYNIKKYDLVLLNAIYQGFTPTQVKLVSDLCINAVSQFSSKEAMRMAPFANKRMRGTVHLDLFDSSVGSLKDKEAILGLSVQETSVPFNKCNLTDEEKADIISYNRHDVFASMVWYAQIVEPFVYAKLMLCKKFKLDDKWAYIETNALLIARALNVKRCEYADAHKVEIKLHPKIEKYCYDNLDRAIVDRVCKSADTYKLTLFENEVVLADGGIHSAYLVKQFKRDRTDTPILFVESDADYVLVNVDAESYYPSMSIQFQTLSRSIPSFEGYNAILQERFTIKHKPDKTQDDMDLQLADKLVLNTTYGASGCEWLPMYDPYQRTKTCRYGQLFLLALANKIVHTLTDAKIIQMNTDGILAYIKRSELALLDKLIDEWSTTSGIGMEKDFVEKIWQRDVNNYLLVKQGGKMKIKGGWLSQSSIRPGYVMVSPRTAFVCAKAVTQWLLNGKDIKQSIINNTDLMDFAITTTKGPTFKGVVQRMNNGFDVDMPKCNRLIATTDEKYGKLYKFKEVDGKVSYNQMPNTPEHCLCINDDMSTYTFAILAPQIDFQYYIERAKGLIDFTFVELTHGEAFKTHQFDYAR